MEEENQVLAMACPSFRLIGGGGGGSGGAADDHDKPNNFNLDDDGEFEFAALVGNGELLPVYPVFNRDLLGGGGEKEKEEEKIVRVSLRKLMIEEKDEISASSSCASSELDELDGVPEGSYCIWKPKLVAPPTPEKEHIKKCKSTGSCSRKWRLRDLVMGRSHSDGKEKFFFLSSSSASTPPSSAESSPAIRIDGDGEKRKKMGKGGGDMAEVHRLYYGKGTAAVAGGGERRQSFLLPYRRDHVAFFHPF